MAAGRPIPPDLVLIGNLEVRESGEIVVKMTDEDIPLDIAIREWYADMQGFDVALLEDTFHTPGRVDITIKVL